MRATIITLISYLSITSCTNGDKVKASSGSVAATVSDPESKRDAAEKSEQEGVENNQSYGVSADGVPGDGVPGDGVPGDGVSSDGVSDESELSVQLRALHSKKCLSPLGASPTEGASIVQKVCGDHKSQLWKITPINAEHVQVISALSGLCLSAPEASGDDVAAIEQAACNPEIKQQRWRVVELEDGVQFVSAQSAKCMDVMAHSIDDDAQLIQWQCSSGKNQIFQKLKGETTELAKNMEPKGPGGDAVDLAPAISCDAPPVVTVEATEEWREEAHGGNHAYANFYTPLMHSKGSSYWVRNDTNYRPHVSKITNKEVETVELAPNYRTRQNNHNLFSLGVDKDGYIHVVGDMQNGPNPRGSDYPSEYHGAHILYWKSNKPHSVKDGFSFLGKSPAAIPAHESNGIRFFTDTNGELYCSAAVTAIRFASGHWAGMRGIGLYRYDAAKRTWLAIGGKPSSTPKSTPDDTMNTVLFWEHGGEGDKGGEGNWFQGLFHTIKFDVNNRLHFATPVVTSTDIEGGYNRLIYAYSDNGGSSWKKADGTAIGGMPIRGADGVANQGHAIGPASERFNWQSNMAIDKDGHPGVWIQEDAGNEVWWVWDGRAWSKNNSVGNLNPVPQSGNAAPGGSMILTRNIGPIKVHCQNRFSKNQGVITLEEYDRLLFVEQNGILTTGSAFGIASNSNTGKQSLIKITYQRAQ